MAGSSQVFYRKWRPQRFDEVVGQEHVAQTLRRAVATGRVHHAYLFCGPRGVGKTSTARILAKALNCLSPQDGAPDNNCEHCRAVSEGRMMDLIEIDAASNRGIDDIRSLREKAQFAPGTAKYKVYIIDEVHMLTDPAFNALLKTLEEPPPHAIMVLATTDVHKVPLTIVSRCQRFDFKRISNDTVIDRLAELCGAEDIDCEPEVLAMIARAAWGSLRDAENLLEQLAVSYSAGITEQNARDLLGLGNTTAALELATAVLNGDAATALGIVNAEASRGADLRALRAGVIDALRAALLLKSGVEDALSHSEEVLQAMGVAGRSVSLDRLLHALSVFGQSDLKQESSSPLPLELAVLQAITMPAAAPPAPAAPPAGATPTRPPAAARSVPAGPPPYAGQDRPAPSLPSRAAPPPPPEERDRRPAQPRRQLTADEQKWDRVCKLLRRTEGRQRGRGKPFILGSLLKSATPGRPENGVLPLTFSARSMYERLSEEMGDARSRTAIEQAIADAYGLKLEVRIAAKQAEGNGEGRSAMDSGLVRAAMAMGGRIIEEE